MVLKAKEIAVITEGILEGNGEITPNSIEFDSRLCKKGSFFIPIKGKRDGHLFIEDAIKRGAVGVICEKFTQKHFSGAIVRVKNTFEAFKRIADYRRKKFSGTTIGITGSVGKTTTKELLSKFLNTFKETHKNVLSYNNLLGVLHTLSNLNESAEFYVQELGTNAPGEIEELSKFVKPDISVITSIEPAHLEGFGSYENLLKEKISITKFTEIAILPEKFEKFSFSKENILLDKDVKLSEVEVSENGTFFRVWAFGEIFSYFSKVPGFGVPRAVMVALSVAKVLGIPVSPLKEVVENFEPPPMRMNLVKLGNVVLIEDCYNANPSSMKNAIDVLSSSGKGRKVAILGEMKELGNFSEEAHREIGRYLEEKSVDVVIGFGELSKHYGEGIKSGEFWWFTDREKLVEFVERFPLEESVVLVKGSRANKLEVVCEVIKKRFGG